MLILPQGKVYQPHECLEYFSGQEITLAGRIVQVWSEKEGYRLSLRGDEHPLHVEVLAYHTWEDQPYDYVDKLWWQWQKDKRLRDNLQVGNTFLRPMFIEKVLVKGLSSGDNPKEPFSRLVVYAYDVHLLR